jgi:hypothetical protein
VWKQTFEAVIDGVHVQCHRYPVPPRDFGCLRHRGRIVSIHVQQARTRYFFHGDRIRFQAKALLAFPQYRSFAGGLIDQNIRGLARTIRAHFDILDIDAGFAQAFHLDAPAFVVADRPDVFHSKPELRAGHQGARNLPARAQDLALESHFPGIGGKMPNQDQCIGCVETDSGDVITARTKRSHELKEYRRRKSEGGYFLRTGGIS